MLLVVISIASVLALRWVDPPGSAFIFAYELKQQKQASQSWVPIQKISPWLQIAVIASEDQKFPDHFGFDIESIKKAMDENRRRKRGASTITQQVAKNLFLWNGRSYLRKGLEAWFTLWIEICWSKQRVLEVYLNIAEFGPGVYGAEAASTAFFRRHANQLKPAQASTLAAVLPNPKRLSAAKPSYYVQSRADTIFQSALKLGGIEFLEKLN